MLLGKAFFGGFGSVWIFLFFCVCVCDTGQSFEQEAAFITVKKPLAPENDAAGFSFSHEFLGGGLVGLMLSFMFRKKSA